MGQTASSGSFLHGYLPQQTHALLVHACRRLLTASETKILKAKVNATALDEKVALGRTDLGLLVLLDGPVLAVVYACTNRVKTAPFFGRECEGSVTADELVVAATLLSGRFQKLKLGLDYDELFFVALASSDEEPEKTDQVSEVVVTFCHPVEHPDDLKAASRAVDWAKFMDSIPLSETSRARSLVLRADLVRLLGLFLMISTIPKRKRCHMHAELRQKIEQQWSSFESAARKLVLFACGEEDYISFAVFKKALVFLRPLMRGGFEFLVDMMLSDTAPEENEGKEVLKEDSSHLVDPSTVSLLACVFASVGGKLAGISLSRQNLVKLYLGSESGFSIRSLELKVLKWQAPTILLVGGKRVRSTNRRYDTFDSEFPRFFRALENPLASWQSPNDRITYAVLVHEPWRISNKKNFGDANTTIVALEPNLNVFKGRAPESVYFNTTGMGLGFGNAQPINKNSVRRYAPGNVSLTIEANLEYAVFRHISSQFGATDTMLTSLQPEMATQDYEDRFLITDLEVWGVGSTKQLEEQKKHWEWEKKQAEARQSVNLRGMGEDRALLEMVGLVGNHGSGGSV